MKIGLIDADLMWGKHANGRRYGKTKADIFPNLAIMKLSAWHKQQGIPLADRGLVSGKFGFDTRSSQDGMVRIAGQFNIKN